MRTSAFSAWAMAAILSLGSAVCAQEAPAYEKAHTLYESMMSQYKAKLFDGAAGLLEEFVKRYPTNEAVPTAYLQLATCRENLKDDKGADAALDEAIKNYPGSAVWYFAISRKMAHCKAQNKADDYLALLETVSKAAKEVPLDLSLNNNTDMRLAESWFDYEYLRVRRPFPSQMGWMNYLLTPAFVSPGPERDLTDLCTTIEEANKALQLMGPTLKARAKELPPEWQYAHALLLRQAGKTAEAQTTLQAYQDEWGDDLRGLRLLLLRGNGAQDANDDKTADAAFAQILKTYGGCGCLAEYLGPRLGYLAARGRTDDFTALARHYLKEFPRGPHWAMVVDNWLKLVRSGALKDPNASSAEAEELLGRYYGKDSLASLQWQLEFCLQQKKADRALELAQSLADDKHWCAATFDLLVKSAKAEPALQKVVDDVRKKCGVAAPDPASPAAAVLKQIQDRLATDQVRFAEELCKQLAKDSPSDAFTVDAIKAMYDYYYAKVLPGPRDGWLEVMTAAYERHPQTQVAMQKQADALRGAQMYTRLADLLDSIEKRFPALTESWNWRYRRLECFDAAKDVPGRLALVQKYFAAPLAEGDPNAIEELIKARILEPNDLRQVGEIWLEQANALKGTRGEIYCLGRVAQSCYGIPRRRQELGLKPAWDQALEAIHRLQQQKLDPEVRWYVEFTDVALLAEKKDAKASLEAMVKKLKTAKKFRDMSLRLNLDFLGDAWRDANQPEQALAVAGQLDKLCYTVRDRQAVGCLLGDLSGPTSKAKALEYYMRIISDCPWPGAALRYVCRALPYTSDFSQCSLLVQQYLAKIPHVSDAIPRVLAAEAHYCAAQKDAANLAAIRKELAAKWPASQSLADVEGMLANLNKDLKK